MRRIIRLGFVRLPERFREVIRRIIREEEMMNSRWQANKIGLINFWYYDEQEFPFVKGRILLRGSNGSGKSVTMQSVVPLLLDGNMSPERLDPFGSRDRKMSSYLLEEDDGREERTGYLYLEFKRQDTDTYLTIGMGIRARRGKNLDKWYFSLTDGRRVGKDFYLYKETGEKVTLSKKELENRIGTGGRVIDRQADYMEYVNRQIFGFETVEEYKEMVDLLIQLRTPKLSKDFKPSVINDILSDSLQPLSDDDLRPMSEAIENMDTMNMNLKNRKEAKQAAEKIQAVFSKYNQKLLYEKADRYEQAEIKLENAKTQQKEQEKKLSECRQNIEKLQAEHQELDARHASMEKERESLNKSDAVALKRREAELTTELEGQQKNLREKQHFLELKQDQYQDAQNQIKAEEDRKYEKEKELKELIEEMQDEADTMAFEEHAFMKEELEKHPEEPYKFELHQQQLENRFQLKKEEKNRILYSDDIEKAMEIILRSHGGKLSDSLKNILQNGLNNCMNEIKDSIRVVCLSEVYNSMLMWSHYAQNHKGFCIEYEFDESNTFYKHLHPIIYTKERYTTSKRDMSNTNGKWIYKTICRKSDVWSYEKEWRIVTVNFNKVMPDKLKYPNGKYVLDLKENIKAFYLGAKIEKKYKEEIIWFAKQNNVEVYQMNLSPDSYDLITKRMI